MTLLREIQAAALDGASDLPSLLRKCKVLAARLRSDAFKNWVEYELNGYDSIEALPPYRILKVNSFGNFTGPFGSGGRNVPIPISCAPKNLRERLRHCYLTQPISGVMALIDGDKNDNPIEQWPADIVAHMAGKIYSEMNCISAWKVIPRNVLVGIVDTVRNRVLSFALEIEQEAPDAGEAPSNSVPVPQEKVMQIFNTYVSGTGHNVATGGTNVQQLATVTVIPGNLDSLKQALAQHGVSATDLQELEKAVVSDQGEEKPEPFGPRAMAWMAKMLRKAATGAWKTTQEVGASILTKALSKYYGLD